MIKSLVISLLNLSVDHHRRLNPRLQLIPALVLACLSMWERLGILIHLAVTVEDEDAAVWLWTVIEAVISEGELGAQTQN